MHEHDDDIMLEVGDTRRSTYALSDAEDVPVPLDELYLVVHRNGVPFETFSLSAGEIESEGTTHAKMYVFSEPGTYEFQWQARGRVSDTSWAFDGKAIQVKPALARS